jgi:nitroimidazol reductase NimA-like FMN-containing flavoprotein (pyridoxamine 5'-phosphate oxidase superfamily)
MRRKEKEISGLADIEAIFSRCDVCRIALANDDLPYIVTLNFGYRHGEKMELFFHCANEGRKLDMIRKNNNVCFAMDTGHELYKGDVACDFGMKYRSVLGFGKIFIVTGEEGKKEGLNVIMKHYSGRSDHEFKASSLSRTTILRLEISSMTGKEG